MNVIGRDVQRARGPGQVEVVDAGRGSHDGRSEIPQASSLAVLSYPDRSKTMNSKAMQTARNFFICRSKIVADVLAMLGALLLATQIAGFDETGYGLLDLLQMRVSVGNLIGLAGLLLLWVQTLRARNLYKPHPFIQTPTLELKEIAICAAVITVVYAALAAFFGIRLFTPKFFVVFIGSLIVLTWLFRSLLVRFLQSMHLGDNNIKNVVIIGTNQTAWEYARQIRLVHGAYRVLGFVDDLVVISESQDEHLGTLDDFGRLLDSHVIDELIVAMPIRSCSGSIQSVIDQAHERGIAVRFPMAQIFSGLTTNEIWRTRQEATLGSDGYFANDLVVYSGHELGARYFMKRSMDVLLSTAMLLAVSPILLLAGLAIYFSSGRPVIFVQERYGYNGRIFHLYKFRTMVKNADALQDQLRAKNERDGAAFKMKNDPRVTPLGRFLRKTSIDELPQLFNVLKGQMSLVGPRPLPLADYRRMNKTSHRRRLSVLPGITGPWQISGRDQISFEEWMQMDLDYIDNWRLMTDIKIILMTVPTVLLARGSK